MTDHIHVREAAFLTQHIYPTQKGQRTNYVQVYFKTLYVAFLEVCTFPVVRPSKNLKFWMVFQDDPFHNLGTF